MPLKKLDNVLAFGPLQRTRSKPRQRPRKKTRRLRFGFAHGVFLFAVFFVFTKTPMAISSGGEIEGVVTRVVDGDTFYISGTTTRIRLWGLDAPERAHAAGPAATRELKRLAEGRRVTCRKVDEDRYGRIVGQCFLSDGDDIAALMIKSGTAREFLRYSGGYYSAGGLFGRRE